VARSSVAAGVAVAQHAPPAIAGGLLSAVRVAYTDGIDVMLGICAGIAIAAAILAFLFVPALATGPVPTADGSGGSDGASGASDNTATGDDTATSAGAAAEAASVSGVAGDGIGAQ
jgi:hypothetical protein